MQLGYRGIIRSWIASSWGVILNKNLREILYGVHISITGLSCRGATCEGIVHIQNPEIGVEAVQDRAGNKEI